MSKFAGIRRNVRRPSSAGGGRTACLTALPCGFAVRGP
jgi:hypothetical protein